MDIAGLAVGVVALAGIFNDCKDLLACFLAAKSMSDDYKELVLMFNFQRTFLDDWAKRVCLLDRENYDKRLDEPRVDYLVAQGLCHIHKLLQDGKELQKRYGLKPAKPRSLTLFREIPQKLRSIYGTQQLQLDQHVRSGEPMSKNDDNKNSVIDKITWVIKDKERFESLLRRLTELIECINKAIPPLSIVSANTLPKDEKDGPHFAEEPKTIENIVAKENNDMFHSVSQTLNPECIKRVLDRLWFRFIDDRKDSIKDAHSETFKWAIRRPAPETKWNDLRQWLRSGNDIYWISGKPGSGKSTLMKYLFEHPEVAELLEEWAGNQKLTMAAFFLWNVGTSEQNTQLGLARGLLYHVLEENQSLIPVVLPNMWREARDSSVDVKPPSSTELEQAFQQLGNQCTDGVFAFFIDGIDEFKGNHSEGISFIQSLANSARIKILLSSREINECNTAFSMKPKMRLQDLTMTDIRRYVNDTIQSHLNLPNTSKLGERDTHELIVRLLHKAQGVFLWVVLACRVLRDRLKACDKAKELHKIIDELPQEFEDLFRSMLKGVPQAHQQETAKLLRLCYVHTSNTYERLIDIFSLAWAYEKDMSLDKMQDFTKFSLDEIKQQCTTFEVRLRSLCRGLLEVVSDAPKDYSYSLTGGPSWVRFMHRTVFEFLDSPAAPEMDCLKIHDNEFDPIATLAYMQAYQIYLSTESIRLCDYEMDTLVAPLELVSRFSPAKLPKILDRYVLAFMKPQHFPEPLTAARARTFLPVCLAGTSNDTLESFFGYSQYELSREHAALLLAVELHLYDFVKDFDIAGFNTLQISQHPEATERRNLLFYAIVQPMIRSVNSEFEPSLFSSEMIETLLDSGCDPNQVIVRYGNEDWDEITTPWHEWLSWLRGYHVYIRGVDFVSKASFITAKMLEAGADLYPKISTSHGDLRVYLMGELLDWIEEVPKIDSKELFLQIGGSCMVICDAIQLSLKENPEIIEKSDEDDEDNENEDSEEDEDSEGDEEEE